MKKLLINRKKEITEQYSDCFVLDRTVTPHMLVRVYRDGQSQAFFCTEGSSYQITRNNRVICQTYPPNDMYRSAYCARYLLGFDINLRYTSLYNMVNIMKCSEGILNDYINSPVEWRTQILQDLSYIDKSKPSLKKAYGMPYKWIKWRMEKKTFRNSALENFANYCKNNFTLEYLEKYYDALHYANYTLNKKVIECFYAIITSENGYRTPRYLYQDYLSMRESLPSALKHNFPLTMSLEKIKELHDKIVPVYNNFMALQQEEKLAALQTDYEQNVYKLASKFEYSNDEYQITACQKLSELITEGQSLHHCVGSYTNSVSQGKEYILFLRKVQDPNTPYFTIDVTPEKKVRQIHGSCNCNLPTELAPFINEWSKKFGLDISNCNGVRCAIV